MAKGLVHGSEHVRAANQEAECSSRSVARLGPQGLHSRVLLSPSRLYLLKVLNLPKQCEGSSVPIHEPLKTFKP